jgi:hypothetical protein
MESRSIHATPHLLGRNPESWTAWPGDPDTPPAKLPDTPPRWWAADQQTDFVTFEVQTRTFDRQTKSGQPVGDLLFDPAEGDPSGAAPGVDRRLFDKVVVAIMRAYRRDGTAPRTAHVYFY